MRKKMIFTIMGLFLLLGGFLFNSFSQVSQTINIAGGVTSESQILAFLVSEMIEHETQNQTPVLNNLGSANIMHQAMLRGDIDIAATRYTGTDLIGTLKLPLEKDPEVALKLVQDAFKKRYQQA